MDAAGVAPRARHTLDRTERGPQASTRIIIERELDKRPQHRRHRAHRDRHRELMFEEFSITAFAAHELSVVFCLRRL
jgi:hypothetical protein